MWTAHITRFAQLKEIDQSVGLAKVDLVDVNTWAGDLVLLRPFMILYKWSY